MRKTITAAITGFIMATAVVGSASAYTYPSDVPHVANPALQDQLERDAQSRPLDRAPAGVVVSRGDQTPNAATASNESTAQQSAEVPDYERPLRSARFSD